jgi:hypothetical protein
MIRASAGRPPANRKRRPARAEAPPNAIGFGEAYPRMSRKQSLQ